MNKPNEKGFGKFPKSILFSEKLSTTAKTIYAYLTVYANAQSEAFPSILRIMKEMRFGEKKVRGAVRELVAAGKLSVTKNSYANNTYTLLEQTENFAMLPKSVFNAPMMNATAKMIYLYFRVFADQKDDSYSAVCEVEGHRVFGDHAQIRIMETLEIMSKPTIQKGD